MSGGTALLLAEARKQVRSGEARELRLRARLSLAELANEIGVNASTLLRWEGGRRQPSGVPAVRYARLLRELASQ